MTRPSPLRLALAAAALALGSLALYAAGLDGVPFHPDESTYLFMSRDFATAFLEGQPARLAWTPGAPLTPESRYRLLDGPAQRYLVGLGWWLAGERAADLNADWDWRQSWATNVAGGALPRPELLHAGRTPAAVLGALTAVLLLGLGAVLRGPGLGLVAGGLLLLHPLMLLHARRAMAEGPLLFASALTILAGLALARLADRTTPPGWRRLTGSAAGLGAAFGLALAVKASALALVPALAGVVGLAFGQARWPGRQRLGALMGAGLIAGAAATLVFLALSPVLWRAPRLGLETALALRTALVREQTSALGEFAPQLLLPGAAERLRAAVTALTVQTPAAWDVAVADQVAQLAPQVDAYLAAPLQHGSLWAGAGLAGLATAGLAFSALRLGRDRCGPATRGEQAVWAWAAATLAFTLWAVPFDWQRYFLPLLPPLCLFAALGLDGLAAPLLRRLPPLSRAQL